MTVRELVNRFLTAKRHLVDTRHLSPRTFTTYRSTGLKLTAAFGPSRLVSDLRADDFETLRADFARGLGPVTLGHEVCHARMVFKYAYDAGLIDIPVRFGPTFKVPARRTLR